MVSVTHNFGPYTPMRQAGDLFFVSGQVGIDAEKKAAKDVSAQAHRVLKNMQTVLAAEALSLQDVVKTTVFLKDMADFAAVNEVYMSYFPEPRPARSCVEVAALPKIADNELLVEIEAVAYRESA